MNKKRLIDLTAHDLIENQVWKYFIAENIEYVSPSDCTEITENNQIGHIVLTDFHFRNRSKHIGYCTPQDPGGIDCIQPVVFSKKGPVEFYRESEWTADEKDEVLAKLGLNRKEVFPVEYTTRVKCNRAFFSGTLKDFNEAK